MSSSSQGTNPEGNGDQEQGQSRVLAVPIFGLKGRYAFIPSRDITAWELAQAMSLLLLAPISAVTKTTLPGADLVYDHLSEGVKRHFAACKLGQIVVPPGAMEP